MRQQKVDVESPRFVEHPDGGIEGGSFAGIGSSLPAVAQVKKQLGGGGRLSHAFSPRVQPAHISLARPRLAGGSPRGPPPKTPPNWSTSWAHPLGGPGFVGGARRLGQT